MHQILDPGPSVVNLARASATTAVRNPLCATPGCTLHAVFRATLDVHFPQERYPLTPRPRSHRATYLACLPCYAQLRRGQADAYVEILAVEVL